MRMMNTSTFYLISERVLPGSRANRNLSFAAASRKPLIELQFVKVHNHRSQRGRANRVTNGRAREAPSGRAQAQLNGWHRAPSAWPEQRDLQTFRRWFECSFHSMIFDLARDRPRHEES
jgi:hypothetical protein